MGTTKPTRRSLLRAALAAGIAPLDEIVQAATGWAVEIADPWGNILGFTDYTKRPALGRRG